MAWLADSRRNISGSCVSFFKPFRPPSLVLPSRPLANSNDQLWSSFVAPTCSFVRASFLPPRRARLRCDSLSNPPKRTPTPPRFLTSSRSSLSVPPPRESSYLYFGRTCLRANDLNRNMEQIHNSDPRGKRSGLCVNSVLCSRGGTLYFRSCWILCIFCPA